MISLDYPEDAWKELDSIKWEYRPEALQYFLDGIIYGALSGSSHVHKQKEMSLMYGS